MLCIGSWTKGLLFKLYLRTDIIVSAIFLLNLDLETGYKKVYKKYTISR